MYKFLRFPDWKDKAMTLSYDDCVVYDEQLISIMQRYGLKGTFNINAGLKNDNRMAEEKAVELYKNTGMEIAMHGFNHLMVTACMNSDIIHEFYQDKTELEDKFGNIIRGGAYAYGVCNEASIQVIKALGLSYFRTIYSTYKFDIPNNWLQLNPTCHHKENIMELFDEFVAEKPDKIYYKDAKLFYMWGHSYEFNDNNWDVIEKFGEKVAERKDIWHATNIEIYDYVKAYENLIFSVKGDKVLNNSIHDVYFWVDGQNVLAKAGQLTKIG